MLKVGIFSSAQASDGGFDPFSPMMSSVGKRFGGLGDPAPTAVASEGCEGDDRAAAEAQCSEEVLDLLSSTLGPGGSYSD